MLPDFRQQVRVLLIRKGQNANSAAKRAGLRTSATLYNYLKGTSNMTTKNLEKVLDALRTLPDVM